MTPVEFYTTHVQAEKIRHDQAQWLVLLQLQQLYERVLIMQQQRDRFWGKFIKKKNVTGLYLWGGVGIGKTFLMDCFYNSLPFSQKKRIHFHAFMQWVHTQLKLNKGIANPLAQIAKDLAKDVYVLCFDEFLVNDIANAMLLGQLLKACFANGICIVATSNTEPDKLYWHGLQREAFLPAIAAIKSHMQVIHLQSEQDYRLLQIKNAQVCYTPHAESAMQQLFAALTRHEVMDHYPIAIDERLIPIKQKAGHVIWFTFKDLCQSPLSQNDYLEIAKLYQIVFVSHIPVIPAHASDTISRFINLIDVFYDAQIKLVLSTDQPLTMLYTQGIMLEPFQRTLSRLTEMQSEKYWSGK